MISSHKNVRYPGITGVLTWQGLSILNVLKRLWEQNCQTQLLQEGFTAPEEIKWKWPHKQLCPLTHTSQREMVKIPFLPHGTAQHLEKHRGLRQLLRLTFRLCSPTLLPAQSQGQEWHWQKACVSFHPPVTLASASIISGALGQPLLKAADLYLHCAGLAMNLTAPKQQQQARASPRTGGGRRADSWEGRKPEEKLPKSTPKG